MELKNKAFAALFSLSVLGGVQDCPGGAYNKEHKDYDLNNTESLIFPDIQELDSPENSKSGKLKKNTNKQAFVCLETDSPESFTHTKVLESIDNPENTTLEFPVSQLFQKYGNRSHPLSVRGIKKDFKALLGKNGIEDLSKRIPQKLSPRTQEIISDTEYAIGDTIEFSLLDPSLKGVFKHYLSDQLKEEGFEGFSDTEKTVIEKKISEKAKPGNDKSKKGDFIYDIVIKKLPSGKSALALYRDGELFMNEYVSVGLNSRKTKTGQFKILKTNPYYFSKKYKSPMSDGAEFDEGGFWLHQGNVTGYPASHGCVRQGGLYANIVYSLVKGKSNTDVFISNNLYK